MSNDIFNDPNAYLRELQRIEREQELAKLRTLSLEFAGVLDYFPKLREELEAFHHADGIAFDGLADRLRPVLKQSADIQFEIEHFPAELRNTPEIQAFIQKTSNIMSLQSSESFINQFHGICHEVRQRLAQEKITQENKIAKENEEYNAKIRIQSLAKKSSIIGSFLGASVLPDFALHESKIGKTIYVYIGNDGDVAVTLSWILVGMVLIAILGWRAAWSIWSDTNTYEHEEAKNWSWVGLILLLILWVMVGNGLFLSLKQIAMLFGLAIASSLMWGLIAAYTWVKTQKERENNKEKDWGLERLIGLLILWIFISITFFHKFEIISGFYPVTILTSLVLGVIVTVWVKTQERHKIDTLFRLGFLSIAGIVTWEKIDILIKWISR